MFNKFVLAAFLALGVAWAAPVAADVIVFDPDGNTGALAARNVASFDWNVGNGIAETTIGGQPFVPFQNYYQANLSLTNGTNGQPNYFNNTGAPGSFDSLTVVLGFQEAITSNNFDPVTNTGTLNFAFAAGGDNFFQIYANSDPGDNLSGACFVCGTVIMSGVIIPDGFIASFTGSGGPTQDLDQFVNDDYNTVDTIVGTGSTTLQAQVTSYNTFWFQQFAPDLITFAFSNTSLKLPFQEGDPSACFFATTSTGGIAPICTDSAQNQTGVAPFIGVGSVDPLNGVSGPNTMFQGDANSSFVVQQDVIPEPATLTLLGIGLLGSAVARRRQRKAKK